ncbi:serine protease [Bacteriovoracaceae bacterium]|nr:serine protease [Bacteriovoracaceae bacterium]
MLRGIGRILLLLVICLSFISCAKNKKKKEKREQASKTIELTLEEIDEIMDNQFFTCETVNNSDSCPDGLARVFIFNQYEPTESSVCTGFLIDEDVLITNNHCVTNELDCQNTFIAIHSDGSSVRAKCSEILETESNGGSGLVARTLDYSILKLDKTVDITPIQTQSIEVQNQEQLSTFVVDQIDILHGRIVQLNCKAEIPGFVASTLLISCPIIPGNSGSPVLNSSGNAIGIIWGASSNGNEFDDFTALNDRRATDAYGIMSEFRLFYDSVTTHTNL